MLTEKIEYTFTVLSDEQIQLRTERVILEDGKELHRLYHRQVLEPGQDVNGFPLRIRSLCQHLWTPEVIVAYRRAQEQRGA